MCFSIKKRVALVLSAQIRYNMREGKSEHSDCQISVLAPDNWQP